MPQPTLPNQCQIPLYQTIPAILVVTQTPASAHIVVIFVPPVEINQRSPSQCGADAIKGDMINPQNVSGVQYLT